MTEESHKKTAALKTAADFTNGAMNGQDLAAMVALFLWLDKGAANANQPYNDFPDQYQNIKAMIGSSIPSDKSKLMRNYLTVIQDSTLGPMLTNARAAISTFLSNLGSNWDACKTVSLDQLTTIAKS